MRVLGLDLSVQRTGVCLPDGAMYTFSPQRNDDWRLVEIRDHVIRRVRSEQVDLVMIEGAYVSKNVSGALALFGAHGAVKVALLSNRTPYLVPAPALVKTYALGKGSGKGTGKIDMIKAVIRLGLDPDDDNQADAWTLWAMGMDLAGHPPVDLPATHRRALTNLRLPAALQPQET